MSIWAKELEACWIALRRSKRDRRARGLLLRIVGVLVGLLVYVTFLVILIRDAHMSLWAIPSYLFIYGCAVLILLALRRSYRRQDAFFQHSLLAAPSRAEGASTSEAVQTTVHQCLVEQTIITAALLARAASEYLFKSNEIPDGVTIVTRRALIENLRKEELWDKLTVEEGDLLRIPDGEWSSEQVHQMAQWCEHLRLLRWVLRIDAQITPLAHFPKTDVSLSGEIVKHGKALFTGKKLLESWDIRVERNIAREYLLRCLIERQSRGSIHAPPEFAEWAVQARVKMAGPSEDMLAGVKEVGELDNNELTFLQLIAAARENFSDYLIDQVTADHPVDFSAWSRKRREAMQAAT